MTSLTGNDLYHFHQCAHTLTMKLNYPAGRGPSSARMPEEMQRLLHWGLEHEAAYATREGYETMPDLFSEGVAAARAAVLAAMRQGRPKLFQAVLTSGDLLGVVDLLRRVPGASLFGDYHYEVGDVKSSGRAKAEQVMQVLFYTHLLEGLQGTRPEHGFLVLADGGEWRFQISDYWDYFLSVLEHAQGVLLGAEHTEPLLSAACALCRWQPSCHARLMRARDLSLVPGMTRGRRTALRRAGIETEDALRLSGPETTVPGVPWAHHTRLRRQAQARYEGRALPLATLPPHTQERLYLSVYTDFSRQNAVFALCARRAGPGALERVFFADHPEAFGQLALDAAVWLSAHRDIPWVVWDRWNVRAVERTLGHLHDLLPLENLSKTLWDSWALPVERYDLPEVTRTLGLQASPGGASTVASLRYHLYLAERDPAIRAQLEGQLHWEVAAMISIDRWMQEQERGS